MSANATPPEPSGAELHWRALESLYASAPVNRLFDSTLAIARPGEARIEFRVDDKFHHAAGAAHGTIYFKMLDDAAFYAANTLVTDRFLLTTSFNLHFTRPVKLGQVRAEGRWISGRRRVLVAETVRVQVSVAAKRQGNQGRNEELLRVDGPRSRNASIGEIGRAHV